MGVRLAPRSVEKLSSLCAGFSSQPHARSPVIEQIQCIAVEIAKTESVFTGESDVLKPCAYSSPIDFSDGLFKRLQSFDWSENPPCISRFRCRFVFPILVVQFGGCDWSSFYFEIFGKGDAK